MLSRQGLRNDLKVEGGGLKSGEEENGGLGASVQKMFLIKLLLNARKWLFWKPTRIFKDIMKQIVNFEINESSKIKVPVVFTVVQN